MRRQTENRHMTDLLFTLGLFCALAASALMVVLIGAGVYKDIVARMDENFSAGTSLTYISNKIRQNDALGAISLGELEGGATALVLEQVYNGTAYKTWIYHDDGALKEVMLRSEETARPSDGQRIVEVARLTMDQLDEGLWRFTSQDREGREVSLVVGANSRSLMTADA